MGVLARGFRQQSGPTAGNAAKHRTPPPRAADRRLWGGGPFVPRGRRVPFPSPDLGLPEIDHGLDALASASYHLVAGHRAPLRGVPARPP